MGRPFYDEVKGNHVELLLEVEIPDQRWVGIVGGNQKMAISCFVMTSKENLCITKVAGQKRKERLEKST